MTDLSPVLADAVARRFAILGEPTRIRLLYTMHSRGQASVGELTEAVAGSQANVSKHLNLLLGERLVIRKREGSKAIYRIADPMLIRLCDEVCGGLVKQLDEFNAEVNTHSLNSKDPEVAP